MQTQTTRRAVFEKTFAAAAIASAAITPQAAMAAEPDPLPALVAAWEPLYQHAQRCQAAYNEGVAKMRAAGFEDPYPWLQFGREFWHSEAEVDAYYAPLIEKGTVMAKQCREKYRRLLREKLALREQLGIGALDAASSAADEAVAGPEIQIEDAPPRSLAGAAAKARFGLLQALELDQLDEDREWWPAEARVLAELAETLERMAAT